MLLPRLDVISDYKSEKAETKKIKGPDFDFRYDDFVTKVIIGSLYSELNNLDEENLPISADVIRNMKFKINISNLQRLAKLKDFKIALILDDSSSMNTVSLLDEKITRWNELFNFVKIAIEIITLFNQTGCDVHFLNSDSIINVKSVDQLSEVFENKPLGLTPLSSILKNVVAENPPESLGSKKLLIIIVTDGEPTNNLGDVDIAEFKKILLNRPDFCFTNIVACTDDVTSIGYLNGLDIELPRLDVIKDYKTEENEIKSVQRSDFQFAYGDYVTKAIIGSVFPELDSLDEFNSTNVDSFSQISSVLDINQTDHITDESDEKIPYPTIAQLAKMFTTIPTNKN